MKFTFVAFVLALLLLVDQVVGYRIHVHVPRVSEDKRHIERKEKDRRVRLQLERQMELENMCNYANKIFGNSPNQCSSPPTKLFRDIYKPSHQTELWQFQQLVCVPKDKEYTPTAFTILIALIIIFIARCCK